MWSRGHKWQRCLWEVLLLHQGAAWPAHTPDHSPDLGCGHLPHCNPPLCTALRRLWQTKCIGPAYGVHASHPHAHRARSHPAHASHRFTNTSCTPVPSLLLGVVSGLSSTPPREKLTVKCLLQISLAYQQTMQ